MRSTHLFNAIGATPVSAHGGIQNVSVISGGKLTDVRGWLVDDVTLQQVKAAADAFGPAGIKVKTNHYGGLNEIVGVLRNFRITAGKVVADLHLLLSHAAFPTLIEMAEKMPSAFGLSI